MCGIIGMYVYPGAATCREYDLFKRMMHEAGIRGLHATGVAFVNDAETDQVQVISSPTPVDQFLDEEMSESQYERFRRETGMFLIGHCRYSTSDLNYNQPILIPSRTRAIVHNGVVTQADPSTWSEGHSTNNDSELLLYENDPIAAYPDASIAAIELTVSGADWMPRMQFYRNGKRPLHYAKLDHGWAIASTRGILERAGITSVIHSAEPDVYHKITTGSLNYIHSRIHSVEMQL